MNGTVTGRGRGRELGGCRGVRVRYTLGTADFSIALSALQQLPLLNPQRGCVILSGLREWERSRRLTDTWAANTPCWVSLGELGLEGCADKEMLLSSCELRPPTTGNPGSTSHAKPPPPAKKAKPPALPPTQTHATQTSPPSEARGLRIGQQLIVG